MKCALQSIILIGKGRLQPNLTYAVFNYVEDNFDGGRSGAWRTQHFPDPIMLTANDQSDCAISPAPPTS